ncbi:MBOAT family O-acyltransferase [Falsiroseomonas selenitidurans]|uniref:Probable alginate O-acetylase AlgI n=1 Tax=Falsiroseomonas selenitidurans TaxID=2716335 RepID=A0ABX1EA39_9PROT|nr:MBOAT family protein [Falsiroseomonas selenitidurans]NKC33828.1 MBOAT family protein [Falsiroseomonas selenitidurans]
MLFPTGLFAIFFAAVFAGHWLAVRHAPRLVLPLLLLASLVFYAAFSVEFCVALVAVGLWAWGFGLVAAGGRKRGTLALGIGGVLAWLGWFKYAGFLLREASPLGAALGLPPLPAPEILLPVGISFYTFQAISYMVDVHRGEARAEASPLKVLVYLTFFPHLAAGPIVRAAHFLPQLHTLPDRARVPVVMAGLLILGGLAKKMVMANELATGLVDPVFRDPLAHGPLDILLACYGYTIQIWCDFSGYSDMAIGLAALLGYHFPRNFNQPFRALTLSEFWRRWHISLSTWLRDYLYKPLGGSRGSEARTRRNLLLTMLLGGIWHGAAWTFVLWGALHGAALVAERALGLRAAATGRLGRLLRWAVTFHIVVAAFVLFRAPDLATIGALAEGLAQGAPDSLWTPRLLAIAALGLALHFAPPDLRQRAEAVLRPLPAPVLGLVFGLAMAAIILAAPAGVAPFIYFQF